MQDSRSNSQAEEAAARWAARLTHGRMTDRCRADLEAWLQADRRHRGALLRAQAALHSIEAAVRRGPSVLESGNDSDYGTSVVPVARRRIGMAALAACLLVVIVVVPGRFWTLASLPTVAHEAVDLVDGSSVTLVDGAQIIVEMTDDARTVTLESNAAVFNVAKDAKRPFVVRSGEIFAQAVGTVYSVARVGAIGAEVSVSEGRVLVWRDGQADRAIALGAGDTLTMNPDPASSPASEPGQLSLDNESIRSAAQRFNRVNRMQIIVMDPAIGDVRIVGLFKADDPEQFARAAAIVAGAHVVKRDGHIVLQSTKDAVTEN